MRIFCDFDGTISVNDTTDEILSRFALPEWTAIEEEWKSGAIGSSDCMKRQIALIRGTQDELDAALDTQEIDPDFIAFVNFSQALEIPLTVVSDGVDYFIKRILARYHLQHLPVIANHLKTLNANSYALTSPYENPTCTSAAGVCKCAQLKVHNGTTIFVGDGRSDFCAVNEADLVFAKSTLAVYCEQQAIPYFAYTHFSEVTHLLKNELPSLMERPAAESKYLFT